MFDREDKLRDGAKIWFITGISRGLGRDLAEAVLSRGDVVIGTTRSGTAELSQAVLGTSRAAERLHVLPMDLADPKQVKETAAQAQALYNKLDVVVNNAGYHLLGAIEEATEKEIEAMFAVDFFGPLHLIRTVLPFLRAQRAGHILNVSSVAGLSPKAGYGLYVAAKCAMNGLSESLSQEGYFTRH